jgi:hypothetical protein
MVEIIDLERHAEIIRGYHFLTLLSSRSRERAYAACDNTSRVAAGTHINLGSTLVHNTSVDFINLLCGMSAL